MEAGELRQDAVDPSQNAYSRVASAWLRGQGVLIALILVFLFGVWRYGEKFTSDFNLWTLAKNNTYFALIALGMTFVIMTGGIDLSVGAVVALSAVTAARLSPHGFWVALAAAIGIGLLVGVINGGIIAVFKVQPFIVTLALLLGARGAALNLSHNASVSVDFATNYKDLWQTEIGPVPLPVAIVVVAYILGSIMLNLTRFGRHILAIGGNEEAARLAGLPINRTLFLVYLLSGGLAGLAGALLAAQGNTGSPIAAVGWELTAIASVVVGGTLLTGGRGSVWTTLVGVMLLGLIFNELNFERGKGIFDLTQYWEEVIRGLFLLIVIILQSRLTNTARVTRSM
jgi:ribose/xylose/arabinose/galactoside ABC-type transport system permease subunit